MVLKLYQPHKQVLRHIGYNMDHLTNLYKNKADHLAKKIKLLEEKLIQIKLSEDGRSRHERAPWTAMGIAKGVVLPHAAGYVVSEPAMQVAGQAAQAVGITDPMAQASVQGAAGIGAWDATAQGIGTAVSGGGVSNIAKNAAKGAIKGGVFGAIAPVVMADQFAKGQRAGEAIVTSKAGEAVYNTATRAGMAATGASSAPAGETQEEKLASISAQAAETAEETKRKNKEVADKVEQIRQDTKTREEERRAALTPEQRSLEDAAANRT